ncbi:MAG: hypothetical protein HY906_14915 [Deltaproteobacteria bacterium]|nr:hypothetical protein [Deltaproteobacteria bacterium]
MRASRTLPLALSLSALVGLWLPGRAAAVELDFSGKIQTDLRLRPASIDVGPYYHQLGIGSGVALNQNLLRAKVVAKEGPFTGVADLEFVWLGYSREIESVTDLSRADKVNPYFLRVKGLFVEAKDLAVKGLDLKIGQQVVAWGAGDQFNPTNNLNSNDLYDPLLFGELVPNLMARVDYAFKGKWTLAGVLVPIFRPAILPGWGSIAMAFPDRVPLVDDGLRRRLQVEQAAIAGPLADALAQIGGTAPRYGTVVAGATPVLPDTSFKNLQGSVRLAGVIKEQDIALSYYAGRTDMPHPYLNVSRQVPGRICDPLDASRCVDGTMQTSTYLGYPRMQVVGLNMSGQMNPFKWISKKIESLGYRLEVGLFLPQAASLTLLQDAIDMGSFYQQPAGEYAYGGKYVDASGNVIRHPNVVDSTPFLKWTLGLDYTFNEHLYANVQWVHGFVDEFGAGDFIHQGWYAARGGITSQPADTLVCLMAQSGNNCAREILRPRLGDYLVLGVDVKLREERVLLRLFTIWALNGVVDDHYDEGKGRRVQTKRSMFTAEGFAAVIYPEFNYNFRNGLELGFGALVMPGREHTKFGDPATGGHLVFGRARYSF